MLCIRTLLKVCENASWALPKEKVPQISKKISMLSTNMCMTAQPFTPHCVCSHVASTCKSLKTTSIWALPLWSRKAAHPPPTLRPLSCSQVSTETSPLPGTSSLGPTGSPPLCCPPQLQQTADVRSHQGSVVTGGMNCDPRIFPNCLLNYSTSLTSAWHRGATLWILRTLESSRQQLLQESVSFAHLGY